MDSNHFIQDLTDSHKRHGSHAFHEVSEFMVGRMDGRIHPAIKATPGSGVRYTAGRWVEAPKDTNESLDLDEIYRGCHPAQESLILKANALCMKRNIPCLDLSVTHSWEEVEESVARACETLEVLCHKDKTLSPGFTGKLKKAFRSLCGQAGAGTTLTNFVPTDSYCSILCGGLKVVFKALEQTGFYRQEVYNTLEELPFILNDNAALLDLHKEDAELHRRIASLYTAMYKLVEVILNWFLKRSITTGVKIFINPSGFSDGLKTSLDAVKRAAQRFAARVIIITHEKREELAQQTHSLMFNQNQHSEDMRREFGHLKRSNIVILSLLSDFLDDQAVATQQRMKARVTRFDSLPIEAQRIAAEDLLARYLYDQDMVPTDCENVLRLRHMPGYDNDDNLISTICFHPRFLSWLTLNESSLLYLDTRSGDPVCGVEMSIATAETFQNVHHFSDKYNDMGYGTKGAIICLAFFCSQHTDFLGDVNGSPTELAMSLLLQLVDQFRGFSSGELERLSRELNPSDIESICNCFEKLVINIPADVILVLMIDDLKFFMEPSERRIGTLEVVKRLLDMHRRRKYAAVVKFMIANSIKSPFIDELFTEDESLRIWEPMSSWDGCAIGTLVQPLVMAAMPLASVAPKTRQDVREAGQTGLVLSVYAVTAIIFRQCNVEAYEDVTASRCLQLIQSHGLLTTDICTIDWCIAKHNIAWALVVGGSDCSDFRMYHAVKDAIAGLQWLLVHKFGDMSLHDREMSKRLYCRLMVMDLGASTNAQAYLNLHPLDEPFTHMLPIPMADIALDSGLSISSEQGTIAEDDVDYVSGFNASTNIFLAWWHAKRDRLHKSAEETLRRGLDHIQRVLDDLPPNLRWRGVLSRDPRTTSGHEAQMVDILTGSLYMKSNFLQHFASSGFPHLTHQIITSIMTKSILVIGGSGQQGSAVASELLNRGYKVHILTRDLSKPNLQALSTRGATLEAGNLNDPEVLNSAVQKMDGVFLVLGAMGNEVSAATGVIRAAKEAGVKQLVYTSVARAGDHESFPGWDKNYPMAEYWLNKATIEKLVRNTGFEAWTILQPAYFMQNFGKPNCDMLFPALASQKILVTAWKPDTRVDLIHVEDIARFTVNAFDSPSVYHGNTIALAAESLTTEEIVRTLSNSSLGPVQAKYLTDEEARKLVAQNDLTGAITSSQIWQRDIGYAVDLEGLKKYDGRFITFAETVERQELTL
ncbi:NAD(P)H azoreductase [Paramyrothecium foliicola]|nr:NAD(P)H azoreductase [Paramyrothecium foliicola]